MGFETAFIFNNVQLVDGCLEALRVAAIEALKEDDGGWKRMLRSLFACRVGGEYIDLQLDKKMTKQLKEDFGSEVVPLSEHRKTIAQQNKTRDNCYILDFCPCDSMWNKWRDTDEFAEWIGQFCVHGQIFEFTEEDGGGIWGWELDKGRIRELELKPVGRWKAPKASAS